MKIQKFLKTIIALFMLVFCNNLMATNFIDNCVHLNKKSSKGKIIKVDICRNKFVAQKIPEYTYWGSSQENFGIAPKYVISSLKIYYENEVVFKRVSSYFDLTEPSEVLLVVGKGDLYQIIIRGGQTATAYTATLFFDGDKLIKREVQDGEFPDELYEETKYFWIPDDGR